MYYVIGKEVSKNNWIVTSLWNLNVIDEKNIHATGGVYVEDLEKAPKEKGYIFRRHVDPETKRQWFEKFEAPESTENRVRNIVKTADDLYREAWMDPNTTLSGLRKSKMAQLEEACQTTIIQGFDHTVNGTSYHFSCSLSAQANFQGTDTLFKDGAITETAWTVINNETGKTERIVLDEATFNEIKMKVFAHINANVQRLRDELEPLVEAAQTKEEVHDVTWT